MSTILLVDDDPNILDGLRDILEDAGFSVLAVSRAAEALQALEKEDPSIAMIDYQLPDASGLDLAKRLRVKRPTLKLWMMTGMAAQELQHIPEGLLDQVLTKPVNPAELLSQLRKAL